MNKSVISGREALQAIKQKMLPQISMRKGGHPSANEQKCVMICVGGGCLASGSLKIYDGFV